MQTNVQLYQSDSPDATVIPIELVNLREFTLSFIVGFMRVYEIGKLSVTPAFVGIKAVSDVSFKPLIGDVPDPLLKSRNYMVRQLAEFMTLFGLLEVEITPTPEEIGGIKTTWAELAAPKADMMGSSNKVEEIKLNLEEDPTGKVVVTDDNGTSSPKQD